MPTLHLIDHPEVLDSAVTRRPGVGVLASGASHAVAASLIFFLLQLAPPREVANQVAFNAAPRMIWFPNPAADGGGKTRGGSQSKQPARPAQDIGKQPITMPTAATQPSTDTTTDPPLEPLVITARPMAHGTQTLVGAIASESTSDALGPRTGSGGDGDGNRAGIGPRGDRGIGDGVHPSGPGVTTPVIIQQVKPQYTADAMRAKVQGSVWLECVVMPDGTVGDVRVTRSLDPTFGLDQEAIAAAKRWRFKPGLANGKPVAVAVSIELTFTLR
ncbi:MAG TPA: energy transducer TonB [Steroidobacteraceae bacterium]|nr:energy transducer TonB [Steroidobacteraceae bacterium]